jgi:hypothetical protein
MTLTKFVVKVNRTNSRPPAYVLRMNSDPIQMTSNRKQALIMGKFAAEDAVRSLTRRGSEPVMMTVAVAALRR